MRRSDVTFVPTCNKADKKNSMGGNLDRMANERVEETVRER